MTKQLESFLHSYFNFWKKSWQTEIYL